MLPVFTTPVALFGLLALPALAAVYLLHNRSRPYPVSSLLLWADARPTPDGGRRVDRLRPPLLFWLELLILSLLALAAAGPHLPASAGTRPLIVVLDDSFSMRAGAPASPRDQAADSLREELRRTPRGSVRLVLAGERPQLLGDGTRRAVEVDQLLAGWTCQAASANLDAAVALALELGGDSATVLVLTDHAPDPPPGAGRVRWWAFGTPRPNWVIVTATRTPGPRGDRLLFEVANLAGEPRATTLRVEAGDPSREVHRSELRAGPGEAARVVLELPAAGRESQTVRATIPADDLPLDDAVTLVPAGRRTVRYDLRIGDKGARTAIEKALKATDTAVPAADRPHLLFLDAAGDGPGDEEAWLVRVSTEPKAEAYTGPFVIDRAHPLTDGLSFAGVVWGGSSSPLPGVPVVMAGNVPLLTDTESASGRHELRLRLVPDLPNLTETPAWPALVWNLVHWRGAHLPGLDRANVRLGETATWTRTGPAEEITVTRPDGGASMVPARGRRTTIRGEMPGVYTLRAGPETAAFGVNPLSRAESDLTRCAAGRWGGDLDETATGLEYRDWSWVLVLLALAAGAGHLWLAARSSGTGGRR